MRPRRRHGGPRSFKDGHHVTVIDNNRRAFDRLGSDFPGEMVLGNGIDEDVLRQAGIESADGFASLTNGDNRNIMAAQIALEIFKVPRVITRIYDPIREDVYRVLGPPIPSVQPSPARGRSMRCWKG